MAALVPSTESEDTSLVGLSCLPTVVTLKDTITLRMEVPHGEYLAIIGPDSSMFFLSYPNPTEPRSWFLAQADSFTQMPVIRFRADVRSRPQVYGHDTLESVFTKPGNYVLTVGHKLESEQSSEIQTCTIRLVDKR